MSMLFTSFQGSVSSQTVKDREKEYQDSAITLLQQAVELWRERGGPSEIDFIKQEAEETFSQSMRKQPEYVRLVEPDK